MNNHKYTESIQRAKATSLKVAHFTHEKRCEIINKIAEQIEQDISEILEANLLDIQNASGISDALKDRLLLTADRLKSMASGLRKIANLPDPLDNETSHIHKNGMKIRKVTVPLGCILVIYEARPNVGTDTVGLALKTGNSVILKGSSQTKHSNQAISKSVQEVLGMYGIENFAIFYTDLTHEETGELLSNSSLDLVIPRGGERLKKLVNSMAVSPVLGAGGGICHLYVGEHADLNKAAQIIDNSKTQRPSVCNSLETVLVHKNYITAENIKLLFTPVLEKQVKIRADEQIQKLNSSFELANEEDWSTEYLDLILSVKTVSSIEEAIEHINKYSTNHSDSIITENIEEAQYFSQMIDSACVYVNSSTRFTDGEEFGFGAEIGISTQKLHARGPIGPQQLTTYKYIIEGNGQIR